MIRIRYTLPAFVVAAFLVTGCTRPPAPVVNTKPAEVVVENPVVREVTDYEDFIGRTEAFKSIDIRSRVTGYLKKTPFQDGADIKAEEPLFQLEQDWFQAEYDKAEAGVFQAQAGLKQAESDLKVADAELERAESEITRLMTLGSASLKEKDEAKAAQLKGKAAQLKAEAMIAGAKASIKLAEASARLARQNLNWTTIKAPEAGRVSRRYIDPENLVKADDTILTTLLVIDKIHVNFDVDDRTLLRIRRLIRDGKIESARGRTDTRVLVSLPDEEEFQPNDQLAADDFTGVGTVNFIDNKVDPSTGTLRVRAMVENPEKNKNRLLSPGMFVRVRLPIGKSHPALLVPEEAIGTDQGQKFVYVVNEKDEVVYRPVKLGAQHGQQRVILSTDLTDKDRIIVSGLQRVRPGVRVAPREQGQGARGKGQEAEPSPKGKT